MPDRARPLLICLALAALLGGCASQGPGTEADASLPAVELGRNQVLAWVPRGQAETPAVARAMAHVALGEAKRRTEAELCGGTWIFTGDVTEVRTPAPEAAPALLGGFRAWHYRIDWNPELPECPHTDAATYYRTLSRHLPDWMMLQTPAPIAMYHRGEAVTRLSPYRYAEQAPSAPRG